MENECGVVTNHEEHNWDLYLGEHGLGIVTFTCPGVDNWRQ
jgi:hypothetical protein